MMRASRGDCPPSFCGSAKSSSSSRSLSRSMSLIATLILVADKGGSAFGHPPFPGILRGKRWEPSPFLFEPEGAHGQLLRLLRRQARALGSNHCRDLFQSVLSHGFCEDRISFAEGVDTIDQVDVEFSHIH